MFSSNVKTAKGKKGDPKSQKGKKRIDVSPLFYWKESSAFLILEFSL